MDHFEPDFRTIGREVKCFGVRQAWGRFSRSLEAKRLRSLGIGKAVPRHRTPKNGIAPRAALLTALWGEKPDRKAPVYLYSEVVRTFTNYCRKPSV